MYVIYYWGSHHTYEWRLQATLYKYTRYLTELEDGFRYEFISGCTDQRKCIVT